MVVPVWPEKNHQLSIKVAQKWLIFAPLQKLPKNEGELCKIIVATGYQCLPKQQKIVQSGHTKWYTLSFHEWVKGVV